MPRTITASPLEEEETTRMASYYVDEELKTIQQDLKSTNLSLNEATDVP